MYKKTKAWLTVLAVLAAQLPAAQAQAPAQVYRCGNSYGTKPCADGKLLDPVDTPSAEQKAQADAAAKRDAQLGTSMEKARLTADKEAAKNRAPVKTAKAKAHPPTEPKKTAKKEVPRKDAERFVAPAPAKQSLGAKPKKKPAAERKPAKAAG